MSKTKKIIVSVSSIIVLIGLVVSSTLVGIYCKTDKKPHDYIVLGYLPSWIFKTKADLDSYDFNLLTHINYSFALVDKDELIPTLSEEAQEGLSILSDKLKDDSFSTKILLSIGGAGAGFFCEASKTKASRKKFATACNNLVEAFNLDGIDVDWEFPGVAHENISQCSSCKKDFVELLEEIRLSIGNEKLLTIAGTANLLMINDYDSKRLTKALDFINVMTYDFSDTNQSSYSLSKNALYSWHLAGYPKRKLNIGVPFYGRSTNPDYQYFGYKKIDKLIEDGTAELITKSDETYVRIGKTKISFDTPEMIVKKSLFAKNYGYGGIFCWELSNDLNNTLLNAMAKELK